MAMVPVDLTEFIDNLVTKKANGKPVDPGLRARIVQKLHVVADRAVDVGIMRGVQQKLFYGGITYAQSSEFHDLIREGSKEKTATFLATVLPDWENFMGAELMRFEDMYLQSRDVLSGP
jgi:hypothetical protein